jgi:hypothetical protein
MSTKLNYQPLSDNEFRLLTLLPAESPSERLKLEIFHSSLANPALSYIALSYTWESRLDSDDNDIVDHRELVEVNGQDISLHSNLVAALRCVRSNSAQCIWADALCIDQTNIPERCSQVLLMREIFSRASNVWAWLGREAKDSNLAMDFLSRIARGADDEHIGSWLGNEALQPSYYPTWEALRHLMSRNWWKRAWIIQEFALAQEVTFLCGDRRLSAEDFEAADQLLFVHFSTAKNNNVTVLRKFVPITARTFQAARNLLDLRRRLQRGEQISALASLQMTRLAFATDPRDHLFAKLGLSGRELAELCPPNYSVEPEAVWFAFLSTYIKQHKDLYIICLAGMQPRTYHHLPSWLPDWGPSKPAYPLCSFTVGEKPHWPFFDAANGSKAVTSISTPKIAVNTVLSCEGLEIDIVDGVAGDKWAENPTVMRQSQYSENSYKTTSGAFQALCRTVTSNTNRTGDWGPPSPEFNVIFAKRWRELNRAVAEYEIDNTLALPNPLYTSASGFERAWRSMRGLKLNGTTLRSVVEAGLKAELATRPPEEEQLEAIPAPYHPLWTALEHSAGQACFERFVYTTTKGRLGIGPATVEPGDRVVILLGCRVPVLLRPHEQRYRIIGESYVDGIMYSEAMAEIQDGTTPVHTKTFEIL